MRSFYALMKKELSEQVRTGKLTVLAILFVLFGIMNPAIAKLTPWLMETLSDSLSESGISVTKIDVDALTAWTQFFKNIPIALIVFILMTSSIFTAEYQRGTLIPVLTKGISRTKILTAKALTMLILWTAGFYLCFFITWGYSAYYWDNGIVQHLTFSVFSYYIFGIWIITAMVLFSAAVSTNIGVLAGTGGIFLASYLLSLVPDLKEYLPIRLTDSMSLLTGTVGTDQACRAMGVTLILVIINLLLAATIFNRKIV